MPGSRSLEPPPPAGKLARTAADEDSTTGPAGYIAPAWQIEPAVARKVIDAIHEARAEAYTQRPKPVIRIVGGEWLAFGPVSDQDFELWGTAARWSNPANPRIGDNELAELLCRFVALDVADEGRLLEFASEFGQLGLCHHARPRVHVPGGCPPVFVDNEVRERLEVWRAWARKAHAIVALATLDDPAEAPRWALNLIGARHWWPLPRPSDLAEEARRIRPARTDTAYLRWDESARRIREGGAKLTGPLNPYLDDGVNAWLDETGVGVRLAGARPYVRRPNLIGILGWALLQTVAGGILVACSFCHEPYLPTHTNADRRPRSRGDRPEAHYCPKCRGTPEAKRDIAARYRASPAGTAAAARRRSSRTPPALEEAPRLRVSVEPDGVR